MLNKQDFTHLVERLNDIYARHRPERYVKWLIVLFSFWMLVISPIIVFFIVGNVGSGRREWDDTSRSYYYRDQPPIPALNVAGWVLVAITLASFVWAWRLWRLRKNLYAAVKTERTAVLREFNEAAAPRGVNAVLRNKHIGQNGQYDLYLDLYIEWAAGVGISYGTQYPQVGQVAYGIPAMGQFMPGMATPQPVVAGVQHTGVALAEPFLQPAVKSV
jgi:hypothetical protein